MTMIAIAATASSVAAPDYSSQPCKTPEIARMCVRLHGRLWQGNGTPAIRLWQIGTHHVFGIYSNRYGFLHDEQTRDNEGPNLRLELPNKPAGNPFFWTVYGDFDVCPLEPPKQKHMQAACIVSASHLVAEKP